MSPSWTDDWAFGDLLLRAEPVGDRHRDDGLAVVADRIGRQVVHGEPVVPVVDPRVAVELHQEDQRMDRPPLLVRRELVDELERLDRHTELLLEAVGDIAIALAVAVERPGRVPLAGVGGVVQGAPTQVDLGDAAVVADSHGLESDRGPHPHDGIAQLGPRRLGGVEPAEHLRHQLLVLVAGVVNTQQRFHCLRNLHGTPPVSRPLRGAKKSYQTAIPKQKSQVLD